MTWLENGVERPLEGAHGLADPRSIEHRRDRPYDEQDASHVVHPNGTLMGTYCRDLSVAFVREVLHQREAA